MISGRVGGVGIISISSGLLILGDNTGDLLGFSIGRIDSANLFFSSCCLCSNSYHLADRSGDDRIECLVCLKTDTGGCVGVFEAGCLRIDTGGCIGFLRIGRIGTATKK